MPSLGALPCFRLHGPGTGLPATVSALTHALIVPVLLLPAHCCAAFVGLSLVLTTFAAMDLVVMPWLLEGMSFLAAWTCAISFVCLTSAACMPLTAAGLSLAQSEGAISSRRLPLGAGVGVLACLLLWKYSVRRPRLPVPVAALALPPLPNLGDLCTCPAGCKTAAQVAGCMSALCVPGASAAVAATTLLLTGVPALVTFAPAATAGVACATR